MMDRLGDKVCCNPTVKLRKGYFYPVVDIDRITPGIKSVTSVESVEYTGQSGAKFEDHDVLFARITPCLENGKMAIADTAGNKGTGSTELFVFRGIDGVSDTDYIYYLLRMKHIRQLAANSMTGASGRQRADLGFIKKIQWEFPSIDNQKKISSILSAYDTLIETNNKRVKILEQMAENLYKEWFVRFRFPGHENVEFEAGSPKGWEKTRLDAMIDFDPTYKLEKREQYAIIPMDALSTSSLIIDSSKIEVSDVISGSRCKNGDTLLARITPCLENGKTGFVSGLSDDEIAGGSTEFIVMRSKTLSPYIVYFIARDPYFRQTAILSMKGADGRQRVDSKKIRSIKYPQPPEIVVSEFSSIVKPYFDEILLLHKANHNLAKQRDLLLPRLMSGKLQVK